MLNEKEVSTPAYNFNGRGQADFSYLYRDVPVCPCMWEYVRGHGSCIVLMVSHGSVQLYCGRLLSVAGDTAMKAGQTRHQ